MPSHILSNFKTKISDQDDPKLVNTDNVTYFENF